MNLSPGGNPYVVQVVNLPGGVHAAVATTGDDVYHVFLNDQLSPAARRDALDHEIRHIDGEHLFNDVLPIGMMEQIARGTAPQEWASTVDLKDPAPTIPYFSSLEAFRRYVFSLRPKKEGGPDAPKSAEPVREDG